LKTYLNFKCQSALHGTPVQRDILICQLHVTTIVSNCTQRTVTSGRYYYLYVCT